MSRPLPKEKIKWKVQTKDKAKKRQMMVCYFDKRDAINRLNEAFGINWSAKYVYLQETHEVGKSETTIYGVECAISIQNEDNTITTRCAIAEASDIEPLKSSRSNSLKLAAGMFGFASELYEFPKVYIELNDSGWPIATSEKIDLALDAVYDIHMEGKVERDFYYICGNGFVWTFGYGKKQNKVWGGNISKTSVQTTKSTNTPKETKPVSKSNATNAPQMLEFPTHSTSQNEGGKYWAKAIKCWNGKILTSKNVDPTTGEKYAFVELVGYTKAKTKSYHKVGKGSLQLLISHSKYKP